MGVTPTHSLEMVGKKKRICLSLMIAIAKIAKIMGCMQIAGILAVSRLNGNCCIL